MSEAEAVFQSLQLRLLRNSSLRLSVSAINTGRKSSTLRGKERRSAESSFCYLLLLSNARGSVNDFLEHPH